MSPGAGAGARGLEGAGVGGHHASPSHRARGEPRATPRGAGARGGTRDFAALHAPSSVRRPRTLQAVSWRESERGVEVGLRGDAFGRYGVRLLVGGAALVAAGMLESARWERALESAEAIEGLRAPAGALTLWSVGYPDGLDPFAGVSPRLPATPPFVPLDQA